MMCLGAEADYEHPADRRIAPMLCDCLGAALALHMHFASDVLVFGVAMSPHSTGVSS